MLISASAEIGFFARAIRRLPGFDLDPLLKGFGLVAGGRGASARCLRAPSTRLAQSERSDLSGLTAVVVENAIDDYVSAAIVAKL
jgi:hypothetical protein